MTVWEKKQSCVGRGAAFMVKSVTESHSLKDPPPVTTVKKLQCTKKSRSFLIFILHRLLALSGQLQTNKV